MALAQAQGIRLSAPLVGGERAAFVRHADGTLVGVLRLVDPICASLSKMRRDGEVEM